MSYYTNVCTLKSSFLLLHYQRFTLKFPRMQVNADHGITPLNCRSFKNPVSWGTISFFTLNIPAGVSLQPLAPFASEKKPQRGNDGRPLPLFPPASPLSSPPSFGDAGAHQYLWTRPVYHSWSLSLAHTHTHCCIALHKSLKLLPAGKRVNLVPTEHRGEKLRGNKAFSSPVICPVRTLPPTLQCSSVYTQKHTNLPLFVF